MPQPERMADLVQRHPAEVFRIVGVAVQAGRKIRADQDVGAAMVAADGIPAEYHPAGRGHVVDDDIGRLALRAGDVGQGDQPVEALLQHIAPGRDRTLDCRELLLGGAGMGLDGDRQVSVVPPVAPGSSCSG